MMEEYPTMIQDFEVQREYWGEGRGEGRSEEHGSSWVNTRENGYNGDNWLVDPWAGLQPFQLQASKLTKKQKRRQKRSGDKSIAKDPFKVPEYTVGEELYLEVVPNHACPRVKTPDLRYLKFKAVKLLGTPWRSGCVMEVKCLETPDTDYIGRIFVLKLLDHRFLPMFNWFSEPTIRSMKRFINMVCCGAVDEFLAEAGHRVNLGGWKHDNYHSVKGLFSEWQQQALVHKSCQTVVEDEISAYERLRELQGKCIPKLMYRVRTCPWLNMEEPFSKYFQYEGFVMEKVDGVCLESVGRLPAFLQREIYQQAVNAINTLEYYGFEHKSLASRNLMVRHERQVSGVPYITLIDLHKHLTWSAEDGYFKYREVWNGSMETRMQYVSGFFDPWWDVDCRDDCKGDEWDEHIATGRFAEKNLFLDVNYQDPSDMALAGARRVVSPRALVNARLRWRVIMDDLWFVRSDKDRLQEIDERARLSRVAYKIMQEEAQKMVFDWEWEDWYLRALPRIAEALDYESDGLVERFDQAFEQYCARANGPGLRVDGLADTCFPAVTHTTEEGDSLLATATHNIAAEREDSALSDSMNSSQNVTPTYSPLSLQATAASSTTDLTSLSDSETNLDEDTESKAKEVLKIFIPRKKPLPPIDVESYELGWM